ncbi:putative membrane protein [Burkholderiales bacterium JOSHI_001]|nr:putative membrane protein [Burkholderiales bacterium JOSHI_001]
MPGYVEAALIPGEQLLHTARISLWSVWHLLFFGLLLLPAFGAGLILWGIAYVRLKTTEVAVTTRRLIVKKGLVRRSTTEVNINKVESLHVDQSVMGRLLNYGTLVISGTGASQTLLDGIAEPLAFRKAFVQAQDAAQRAAGG